MTIKMDDIARLANVSKSAVSLALNGKDGVSQETRDKIFDVVNKYGYKPLRKSKKNTTKVITSVNFLVVKTSGLISGNYRSLPFFDSLISSLSEKVSETGGSLKIMTTENENLSQTLEEMKKNQGGGTIVLGTDLNNEQANLINEKLNNIVFVDTYFDNITADFVTMDNYQGASLAGKYILSKGYKRIGYFASDKIISNFIERRRGFRSALKDASIDIDNKYFYSVSPTKIDPQGLDIKKMKKDGLPDAIFCEDDYIAIRLIKAAEQENIKVPKQLAIIGFDDIYESSLISPELTTIHVPVSQMANQALSQLQKRMYSTNWAPQKTLIATKLIKRRSL
ncbi:LacI family DNA-binding transcriptional regulator [Companilactobacillus sp. HBUAS56257]|uniref:LacI family DNA-binding transcriptional regulator n=1 Tax=Companilactobacillus sp. HBUAS56257 TaxID=3109360 RepID=UPI002FF05C10